MLITEMFRTIDSNDWESLKKFYSEGAIYERPGYNPFVGLDQVLYFYREKRLVAWGTHWIDHIIVDKRIGACWGRLIGQHKDGSSIAVEFADIYHFDDGKIAKRKSFFFSPLI
ncbi:MAG TPA: nuclear transport factor 2 family protein [Acidobacteriaceae bacterium]|jgi:hypothetical protein|nr:nuclear transport factor 2 family protein [Acidobacteriaceae bacterium]